MKLLLATALGLMSATGVYLLLQRRLFPVILGLSVLSYAVNLFIFTAGGLRLGSSPVLVHAGPLPDPLPQALILTAIVIGFATTAYVIALAVRRHAETGDDGVAMRDKAR